MAVQWTSEQQQVISTGDSNILVSAAAGSGKTAVLVQRIIEKIVDLEHPVNIDQFVIVTFTSAAAGEMRDRIQAAIEREAALHPENEHLQRQRTRIHMANISTIHSFCSQMIRNHFQEIDLDPAFRVGDEGECKLMRKDVLAQVLEQYYEEGSKDFLDFTETFASGKSDDSIEEMILELYRFAMSFPYPEKWLLQCLKDYETDSYEALMQTAWMKALFTHLNKLMEYLMEKTVRLGELVYGNPETEAYVDIVDYYKKKIRILWENPDYDAWYGQLREMHHPELPRGKKSCPDATLRGEINGIRDVIKKNLEKVKTDYFAQSSGQLLTDFANCRPVMAMLIQVTESFMEAFKEEKRQKNLLDYNDLEHEALRILLDEEGNPTQTAKEYAQYYEEILIDEYQDSNLIQEYLLTAVSKKALGGNNLFMVGDAKQSIYRFRLARPELFMEKFHSYSLTEDKNRRIDLHKNFRSRKEVLDSANYIFRKIMKADLGEIDYNDDAALYAGMEFPESEKANDYTTELLVFDKKDLEMDAKEYEAKIIAHRIRQLVSETDGLAVVDKKTGLYRMARYSDIAILLRSTREFDTVLAKVLAAEGIPAHMLSKEGYFDALEIVTVLNYLRIIDNPYQDIPLLSVLKSPMAGISDEELAKIRIFQGEEGLFESVCAYGMEGEEEALKSKLNKFLQQLQQFRQEMYYMPVGVFICHILDVTGYGDYIAVMPGGSQRTANMDMLIEKAAAFEETSYTGVFQFIRYIEQLQKYQIEMGEASILSENDNTVRIMTIHKSKGLEFPIVFVAGLGRRFNRMDERNILALHEKLGIGMDSIFLENRVKSRTLFKKVINLRNRLESMGEELRVLYVALTRAREKLIMTGGAENLESAVINAYEEGYKSAPAYGALSTAGSYLTWIFQALIAHASMKPLLENYADVEAGGLSDFSGTYGEWSVENSKDCFGEAAFQVREMTLLDMVEEDLTQLAKEERMELELDKNREAAGKELPQEVRQALEYRYPYDEKELVPVKVSVSELKHAGMILEEEEQQLIEEREKEPVIPTFLKEKEEVIWGSDRGTAYHTVFEKLDFKHADTRRQIEEQLEQLYETGLLAPSMRKVIDAGKIYRFVCSSVGQRMKKAQAEGKVHSEQPFVYAMAARELKEEWDSDEPVMIQGIMDVYFEEDGQLVLMDYKTDYVKSGKDEELIRKYQTQMKYYKKALEAITGMKVKEAVIYSVYLDRAICLPDDVLM